MAGGPTLHVLPEKKRKRFRDRTIVLSSLTAQPATMAGVQSPSVWVPYMNPKFRVAGAAPASNTFTVITIGHESPMQIRVPLRGQPSSVLYLHLDRNSAAAEPEGYYSEHVQRISAGYAAFRRLREPFVTYPPCNTLLRVCTTVLILFVTGCVFTASRQLRGDSDFQRALW